MSIASGAPTSVLRHLRQGHCILSLSFLIWRMGMTPRPKTKAWGGLPGSKLSKYLWLFCLDNGSLMDTDFLFEFSTFLCCQNVDNQKGSLKTPTNPMKHGEEDGEGTSDIRCPLTTKQDPVLHRKTMRKLSEVPRHPMIWVCRDCVSPLVFSTTFISFPTEETSVLSAESPMYHQSPGEV